MADMRKSAIVVTLPELDAVLDEHRWALDSSRGWGMPAHLTLLYPFVSPSEVDGDTILRLYEAVAEVISFEVEFVGFGWFADQVAWLAPLDPDPFTNLIRRLTDAFPECPPYGGTFDEVIPHVTIGEGGAVHLLTAATEKIRLSLPLTVSVTSISLMEGSAAAGSWRVIERVALISR